MNLNETIELEEGTWEENTFKNVLLLSPKSRNGRTYNTKAIQEAKTLYMDAPVYLDHGTKNRNYSERIGVIKNAYYNEPNLYGDLTINPKHPMSEAVIWDIKNKTNKVGLSHSIDGVMKDKIVETISRVYSVDIVDSPACTSNFFEQQMNEENELKNSIENLNNRFSAVEEGLKVKLNELEINIKELKREKPVAIAPKVVSANKTDAYSDWLKKIKS